MPRKLQSEGPFWVVTAPFQECFDSWPKCRDALKGARGQQRQMKVETREEADAVLSGRGVVLPPGWYAFTDGNAIGGVGLVVVEMADGETAEPEIRAEMSTSVGEVFGDFEIPGLDSAAAIRQALFRSRNVLAELAGLYVGIRKLAAKQPAKIVHDYRGVGAWMTTSNGWRPAKDLVLGAVVSACRALRDEKAIDLTFRHQRGHRSDWAGRHDFAHFNRLADKLATKGSVAG